MTVNPMVQVGRYFVRESEVNNMMFNNPNSYEEVKSLISEDEYKKIYGGSDRLISEQAVLSAIGEWIAHREYDYTNATEYLRNRIKAIPSAEPKWIPVSERLPKTDEYVGNVARYYLVQNEYGDMLVARYTHSEYWEQIYQLKPIGDEIVAWMPLPKLYEPQERSE